VILTNQTGFVILEPVFLCLHQRLRYGDLGPRRSYFSRDKPYHGLLGSVCISLKVGFIRVRESTGGSIKIRQEKSGSIFFCITLNIKCKEL